MANTEDIIINVEVTGAKDSEKAIEKTTEALQDNTQATEQAEKATEDYSKSLVDGAKDVQIFGVSLSGLSQSFRAALTGLRTVTTALKSFRIALAATGIGLIVVALGSLVTFLQRTRVGVDFLNDALKVAGEVIRIVLDRIAQLGSAIIKVFSGDFKGALEDAKAALTGFNDELRESINLRLEIEQLTRDADQFDRDAIVTRAKLEQDIQKQLIITRDLENTTAEQRLAALREAQRLRQEQIDLDEKAALNRQTIAIQEFALLKETDAAYEDAQERRNQAIADVVAVQTRGYAQLRELQNRVNTEQATIAREQSQRAAEQLDRQTEQQQQALELLNDQETKRVESLQRVSDETIQIETDTAAAIGRLQNKLTQDAAKNAQARVDIAEQENQAIGEGSAQLFGAIASLFGQQSELGKAAAIAQATINTWQAVTAVLKDELLPTVAKPFFVAAVIAQGLAAVKQITSVPIPKVQIESTPFAEGGDIKGNSHARGGVWLNAEGGEYIVNKKAMRDPINRAMVEAINEGKQSRGLSYQQGGFVPSNIQLTNLETAIREQRPVLILEDLDLAQGSVQVREDITNL